MAESVLPGKNIGKNAVADTNRIACVGAALNDTGLLGSSMLHGRPAVDFISENPQDSEISRDWIFTVQPLRLFLEPMSS